MTAFGRSHPPPYVLPLRRVRVRVAHQLRGPRPTSFRSGGSACAWHTSFAGPALLSSNLAAAAHVVGVRRDGVERDARDVGVAIRVVIERRGAVADRVDDGAHATVEPRAAAKSANHGNRHRGSNGRTRNPS